ncbi:unnamed protein product [Gemmata massiliana]|uniref:VCBS repeat-containing protein n=1 Tax=Gemmata massiliana TaxID=1210884 RepID=A0A6P2CXL2_9BACT|nr:VCBS repeat-containing protein [Gemmata massiliana]VTR91920.1 unnamed protein product [Gemmata massiliana]
MRIRSRVALGAIGLVLVAVGAPRQSRADPRPAERLTEFGPPKVILDGSEFAARLKPCYADYDGDGKIDLLVGAWDRLLVYRNRGTTTEPEYAKPTWFDDAVPSGRIPAG